MKIHRALEFEDWLKDQPEILQVRINARVSFIALGYWGNYKQFEGLIEFRFGHDIVIIAVGGTKHGQKFDIKKAKKIKEAFDKGVRTIHVRDSEGH